MTDINTEENRRKKHKPHIVAVVTGKIERFSDKSIEIVGEYGFKMFVYVPVNNWELKTKCVNHKDVGCKFTVHISNILDKQKIGPDGPISIWKHFYTLVDISVL